MVARVLSLVFAVSALLAVACGGSSTKDSGAGSSSTPSKLSIAPNVSIQQFGLGPAPLKTGGVDPATFATSFETDSTVPNSSPDVYAWFMLASGESGTRSAWIDIALKYKGILVDEHTLKFDLGVWNDHSIFTSESASPPAGDYELTLGAVNSTDRKSLKFTVTDKAGSQSPAAKLDQVVLTSNYTGETLDKSRLTPSYFTPQASFTPTDVISLAFSFADPQPSTWVSTTWKSNGKEISPPQSTAGIIQGVTRLIYIPPQKPGDYEVTLTVAATGETRSLKFSVSPGEAFPLPEGLALSPAFDKDPDPAAFKTKYEAWDEIDLVGRTSVSPSTKGREYVPLRISISYEDKELSVIGAPFTRSAGRTWYWSRILRQQPIPSGHYEVTVTSLTSGESKTLPFTVTTNGIAPTPTPRPTATPRVTPSPRPTP